MVIILAKKKPQDDSRVFIGRKKSMNYVLAAMMVINNFLKGAKYGDVIIDTEEITNEDGTVSNVSAMEIEILPPKK